MTLPILQHPTYEVYLKSLDKKIKFRPFLVKEEKILLMAKESAEKESVVDAIKQIITNCCIDDINVDSLPMFDIEMFFINLRMRSIGETISLTYKCTKPIPNSDNICGASNEYELNLENVKYTEFDNHNRDVMLSDTIGIRMKYPRLGNLNVIKNKSYGDPALIIAENVECIYDGDQVYDNQQYTKEELRTFLENLNNSQLNKLLDFFIYSPKVVIKDTVHCSKCGGEHNLYSEDIYNFFL